jgi:hypothetical protein
MREDDDEFGFGHVALWCITIGVVILIVFALI